MPSSCVCLSVCVSVTLQYCIKTAKRRIKQITPHTIAPDSSFLTPKFTAKFERDHPLRDSIVYTDKRVSQFLCHSRASCKYRSRRLLPCDFTWRSGLVLAILREAASLGPSALADVLVEYRMNLYLFSC